MRALAHALAMSLALGPAPVDQGTSSTVDGDGPSASLDEADAPEQDVPPAGEAESGADAEVSPSDAEVEAETPPEEAELEPGADAQRAEAPSPEEAEPTTELEAQEAPLAEPAPAGRLGCGGGKPCERMTIAGVIVGILGVGAVGAGLGMLLNPDRVIAEEPIFVSSTRPAGLVTVTLGVGVTLTAVLMLVAAHKGQRASARVALTPSGLRF